LYRDSTARNQTFFEHFGKCRDRGLGFVSKTKLADIVHLKNYTFTK
jgi:hypothetical protein